MSASSDSCEALGGTVGVSFPWRSWESVAGWPSTRGRSGVVSSYSSLRVPVGFELSNLPMLEGQDADDWRRELPRLDDGRVGESDACTWGWVKDGGLRTERRNRAYPVARRISRRKVSPSRPVREPKVRSATPGGSRRSIRKAELTGWLIC
jgi:hypothetical protein